MSDDRTLAAAAPPYHPRDGGPPPPPPRPERAAITAARKIAQEHPAAADALPPMPPEVAWRVNEARMAALGEGGKRLAERRLRWVLEGLLLSDPPALPPPALGEHFAFGPMDETGLPMLQGHGGDRLVWTPDGIAYAMALTDYGDRLLRLAATTTGQGARDPGGAEMVTVEEGDDG
jgi:hypothetical protein